MENEKNYITKKDFYTAAMHLCLLILFTGMISDQGDGFGNLCIAIWSAGLGMYYIYKLRKEKEKEMNT